MGIEALLTSQVIGLDAALTGKLNTSGGTVTGQLTNALGTITASTPLTISQTWNDAAVTFNPLLVSVTDTQSASGSLLMDLKVGGTSKFNVSKSGRITGPSISATSPTFAFSSNTGLCYNSSVLFIAVQGTSAAAFSGGITTRNALDFSTSPDSVVADLSLYRDAADTLAQRRGTSAQTFRLYNTYTSSTSYERAKLAWESNVFVIGTEAGSAGGVKRKIRISPASVDASSYIDFDCNLYGSRIISQYGLGLQGNNDARKSVGFCNLDAAGFPIIGNESYSFSRRCVSDKMMGFDPFHSNHDYEVGVIPNLTLRGHDCYASAVTNISGGHLYLLPGAGASASAGNANGGHIYLDGGQGYGTGVHGSIIIGNTRAGGVTMSATALSGSQATSLLSMTQTWNTTGTPTLIKANVTDTASASGSLLMDLQVGGTSKFNVRKDGRIKTENSFLTSAGAFISATDGGLGYMYAGYGFSDIGNGYANRGGVCVGRDGVFGFTADNASSPVGGDLFLSRDAADTLSLKRSANAQVFRIYNTYTSSTSYERGKIAWESNVLKIGTEKGSAGGSARALELQTDGVTRLTINASTGVTYTGPGTSATYQFFCKALNAGEGNIVNNGSTGVSYYIGSIGSYFFKNGGDGIVELCGSGLTGTGFGRLQLGGTTSSFPAIKRNSTAINFRLADDSADCDITAKAATFSGNVTISAVNLVTDTTTGTKIGTGTTQKIGFYDKTPVVQPTAVADATDAASVITQLNALLSRMRDLGLIAT